MVVVSVDGNPSIANGASRMWEAYVFRFLKEAYSFQTGKNMSQLAVRKLVSLLNGLHAIICRIVMLS